MTTGSHHMQNYWIRRPAGLEGPLGPDSGALVQIPWVWLIPEGRWIPNQDSFLRPPDTAVQGATPWNGTCSQCHSVGTEPRILPELGRFETRSVELGIACEACHGPAAEHVRRYRSPVRRYLAQLAAARDPDLPDPTIVNPEKLEPRRSVDTCAQCHSFGEWRDQEAYGTGGVPFRPGNRLEEVRSVFRYTEDPGDPLMGEMMGSDPLALAGNFWRDGTIRVAGREFNGMLEDPHLEGSRMTCLSCHSMHAYESPDAQLGPGGRGGDPACVACHTEPEYTADVSLHTRHRPASPGSECMNCHMPHTTYGLFSAMRSHRIDSPSVRVSVETGRPNACNLCHLDETLAWSGRYLNEWYGTPLVELGGGRTLDRGVRPLDPHRRCCDPDDRGVAPRVGGGGRGVRGELDGRLPRPAPHRYVLGHPAGGLPLTRPAPRLRGIRLRLSGAPLRAGSEGHRGDGGVARGEPRPGGGETAPSHRGEP